MGKGTTPVDPSEDTEMEYRDKQTYLHAVWKLKSIGRKSHVTAKDRADVVRLKQIRDDCLAGNKRRP
jgi:hypothetical protein